MLKQILPTVIPLIVVAVVLYFRLRRASKGRPLKPNRLWIRPAILTLFAGLAFLHPAPLTLFNLAIVAVCAVAGIGTGYLFARHQHLTIDPASGAITSRMSPFGILLFLGLFGVRFVIRAMTVGMAAPQGAAANSPQMLLFTDAALLFALGLVAAQAWEIWRRAQALLEEGQKTPESAAG